MICPRCQKQNPTQAKLLRAAVEAVVSGAALTKLRQWVTWQNVTPEDGLRGFGQMLNRVS